jgi:transposase
VNENLLVSDALWARLAPILAEHYPVAPTGRPRTDFRRVLDGVMFRLASGCQWNRLPDRFGDHSTVHRWFRRWVDDGVFELLWPHLCAEHEELAAIDLDWRVDGARSPSH